VTSTRERYQRIAAFYDALDLPFEYRRYRQLRPLLFAEMTGTILDAGVGTGRNFPFYPVGAKVIGIDLSPAMLARARKRLGEARASIELREMDVTHLDFPDRHFDNAVATFLFCVLPGELQTPALMEIKRVLKPGGILRLLEYTQGSFSARCCEAVGTLGALGLRRKLRPQHRTVYSGRRIAGHGLPFCGWRSHQAHHGSIALTGRTECCRIHCNFVRNKRWELGFLGRWGDESELARTKRGTAWASIRIASYLISSTWRCETASSFPTANA